MVSNYVLLLCATDPPFLTVDPTALMQERHLHEGMKNKGGE